MSSCSKFTDSNTVQTRNRNSTSHLTLRFRRDFVVTTGIRKLWFQMVVVGKYRYVTDRLEVKT